MFEAVEELVAEHADLEKKLADPSVHSDQANARKLNKRYAELTPIIATYRSWTQTGDDIETARELGADDPDFAAEVKVLEQQREELTEKLRLLLVPRDPSDDKDVILEIKAGAGGDESALFAERPAAHVPALRRAGRLEDRDHRRHGVRAGRLQGRPGRREDQGRPGCDGARTGRLGPPEVRGRRAPRAAGADGVPGPYPHLRGRCAGHAGGRGGRRGDQPQRPPDRRLPLLGTGRTVRQHHRLRRAHHAHSHRSRRLLPEREEPAAEQGAGTAYPALEAACRGAGGGGEEAADARRSQVRTVDRSEKIRTYNFPENRISDHRVGFKAYNLDQVLDGDLTALIQACVDADSAAKLAAA